VFFATLTVYNFHALYKHTGKNVSTKKTWIQIHRKTIQLSILIGGISAVIFVLFLVKNPMKMLPLLGFISVISFFYVVPIKGKALREQAFMKIIYVSLVWTTILLVIPQLNERANPFEWLDISAFFCLFFAVAIPFDLRDSEIDSQKMKTIPTYFGAKKSKIIALFVFSCSVTLFLIKHPNWLGNPIFWLAISINSLLLITASGAKKEGYYAFMDTAFGIFGLIYFW
jgi:4-hydroxybenzoate polyprenyltransferase